MTLQGKFRMSLAIIALLVVVLVALIYKFVVAGSTLPAQDGRVVVVLTPGERALMLREMRGFVSGLQRITGGLARGDMHEVSVDARSMGTVAAKDVPAAMLGKLPLEFKRLAFGVHGGFDDLAATVDGGATREQALGALASVLDGCVACHAAYQVGTPATPR